MRGLNTRQEGMFSYISPESRILQAAACTYRIALEPRAGQKVLSLQTVPTAPPTPGCCANEHAFSLHAEVCCAAHQRKKLESQGQG